MNCPKCDGRTEVVKTVVMPDATQRFRKCGCGARFISTETFVKFVETKVVPRRRLSPDMVAEIIARDGGACVYCGSREKLGVDHIVPLAFPVPAGADKRQETEARNAPDNLCACCLPCNMSKGDRVPGDRNTGSTWLPPLRARQPQPTTGNAGQPPATTRDGPQLPATPRNGGGVGGALPSGSGPDPAPISPADPDRARALTGYTLCRLFSQVRAKAVDGLPWQSVRVAGGAASDMAAAINDDPGARADVEPTMALLFKLAKDGKAGDQSKRILESGSFAFGAWLSQWTELRERLHGKGPRAATDAGVRGADALVARYRAAAAKAATADELASLRPAKTVTVLVTGADGVERPVGATG